MDRRRALLLTTLAAAVVVLVTVATTLVGSGGRDGDDELGTLAPTRAETVLGLSLPALAVVAMVAAAWWVLRRPRRPGR